MKNILFDYWYFRQYDGKAKYLFKYNGNIDNNLYITNLTEFGAKRFNLPLRDFSLENHLLMYMCNGFYITRKI